MALYFEITEGANKGQRYKIVSGLRIGRAKGEIVLDDPKVSALHAQVEKDSSGNFFLSDRKSSNGIKINGLLTKRAALTDGVVIQVGRTFLTVRETSEESQTMEAPKGVMESLKGVLSRIPLYNSENPPLVSPFLPALKLIFVEGPQADTELTLGYGPRQAGSDVLDIDLQEETAPPVAFELRPTENGPLLTTAFTQIVRVNQAGVADQILKPGDTIQIGKTLIRVEFL